MPAKKTKVATRPKKKAPHLTWFEVNSILGQLTGRVNATLRYLPPNHPESFCQRLTTAGMALERLANEAGDFTSAAPAAGHTHK